MNERDRQTYLGGHDIGAIVGVHPFLSAATVRAIKRGELPPVEQTERMRWGLLLEDAIVEGFSEQEPAYRVRRTGFVGHPLYPFLGGHPDRLLFHDTEGKGILDAKATMVRHGYGDPGSSDVPPYITVQLTWYMGLTRACYAYVARLMGLADPDLFRLDFDPALYEALVETAVTWWGRHVVEGEFVEPDGSVAYRSELRRRFPKDTGIELIATPELQLLAEEYGAASADEKRAKLRAEKVRQLIEVAMGEASSLVGDGFRVTWKVERPRTEWKTVAELMASDTALDVPTYVARSLEGREGLRVLRAHFAKTEEEAA